ncbi:hypothetical protein PENSTE_c011G08194 [Penicillium steckii]|uniref:Uncharacterized protein n=1 Tax=Penicillium steckii TaxID=303698 RepID=A0A1V6T7G9_9EURO|nr:hypothetical protein PENSTE_c011G08194 [Penicillium steckii]
MRLLLTDIAEVGRLHVAEAGDPNGLKYAILSHRWGDNEITLQDVNSGSYDMESEAYRKIKGCCEKAKEEDIDYIWIDTCCIDKTSSAELSEAINSMYFWYAKAEVCYAYLNDVRSVDEFSNSVWFTRGWTLQELIAPSKMKFFNQSWDLLGSRLDFIDRLSKRTGIPAGILSGKDDLEIFSVAQRMSWAATRQTTRIEDQAYCLMGIFGINMPLLYGERENAFIRLQEEILRLSDDPSLFAWKSKDGRGLLAPSPAAFVDSGNIIRRSQRNDHDDPPSISSRGIRLEIPLITVGPGIGLIVLSCQERGSGNKLIALYVRDIFLTRNPSLTMQQFTRTWPTGFTEVALKDFPRDHYPVRRIWARSGRTTGTYEFDTKDSDRHFPRIYPKEMVDKMNTPPGVALESAITAESEEESMGHIWWILNRLDVERYFKETTSLYSQMLDDAVERHRVSLFKMLVSRNTTTDPGEWARRIQTSIAETNIPMIQAILEANYLIGRETQISHYALEVASKLRNESVINALLDHEVLPSEGLLIWSIEQGHDLIARLLIDRGASLEERGGIFGWTPLYTALADNRPRMVQLLLEKGVRATAEEVDYVKDVSTPQEIQQIMLPYLGRMGGEGSVRRP